jgi:hypothetical protein
VIRHAARLSIVAVLIVTGCDLSVSNPGPVTDSSVDEPALHPALVNGMGRSLARALNFVAFTGAAISREIVSVGGQTNFGITGKQQQGILDPALDETNEHWQYAQEARWMSEDGIRRMRAAMGDAFNSSALAAQALVYAGFANRLLGENMCVAIFDGGPPLDRSAYFKRADSAFTEALAVATAAKDVPLQNAARAGRASIRVWLRDWAGAAADANLVPKAFRFQAQYSAAELEQYNRIYWSNANQPFRRHSVVGTFYETYYTTTRDPRTPWYRNPAIPLGSLPLAWLFQTKYSTRDAPIDYTTGTEMRLIVAESMLAGGDWQGALAVVNGLRSDAGVPPWTASNATEAWTALKRERGIDMWLEGRRLGDLGRWIASNTPGQAEDMSGRSMCFPVGKNELDTNPNL